MVFLPASNVSKYSSRAALINRERFNLSQQQNKKLSLDTRNTKNDTVIDPTNTIINLCNTINRLNCYDFKAKTDFIKKLLTTANINDKNEDRIISKLKFFSQEQRDKISSSINRKRRQKEKEMTYEYINEYNSNRFNDNRDDDTPDDEYYPNDEYTNDEYTEDDGFIVNDLPNDIKQETIIEDDEDEPKPSPFENFTTKSFWAKYPQLSQYKYFLNLLIHYVKYVILSKDTDIHYRFLSKKRAYERDNSYNLLKFLISSFSSKNKIPLSDDEIKQIINEEDITDEQFTQELQLLKQEYGFTNSQQIGQKALDKLIEQIFPPNEKAAFINQLKQKTNTYYRYCQKEFKGANYLHKCYPF